MVWMSRSQQWDPRKVPWQGLLCSESFARCPTTLLSVVCSRVLSQCRLDYVLSPTVIEERYCAPHASPVVAFEIYFSENWPCPIHSTLPEEEHKLIQCISLNDGRDHFHAIDSASKGWNSSTKKELRLGSKISACNPISHRICPTLWVCTLLLSYMHLRTGNVPVAWIAWEMKSWSHSSQSCLQKETKPRGIF